MDEIIRRAPPSLSLPKQLCELRHQLPPLLSIPSTVLASFLTKLVQNFICCFFSLLCSSSSLLHGCLLINALFSVQMPFFSLCLTIIGIIFCHFFLVHHPMLIFSLHCPVRATRLLGPSTRP